MNKILNTIAHSFLNSRAIEKQSHSLAQPKKIHSQKLDKNLRVKKNTCQRKSRNSFAVFKYFIVTTSIIFTFGGLGFGFVWRCSHDLQLSKSDVDVNNSKMSVSSISK